jgi:acyl dehydratase
VADHFDPDFDRRPRPGQPWIGSGAAASGIPRDDPGHKSYFHVEQEITYARPVRAGESLRARRLPARRWTKQGRRAGRLEFIEHTTELRDDNGVVVVTSRWLDVDPEQGHQSVTSAQRAEEAQRAPEHDTHADTIVTTLVDNLTRTQIAMYAGASGDFHPLHHDDVYARDRGYPGSFCPGMLTMGLAAGAVTDHIDIERLATFAGRFHAQVWPGDTLRAEVRILTQDDRSRALAIEIGVRNQHGVVVFAGTAGAR